MYGYNNRQIRLLLGRQYRSKGNCNKKELMDSIKPLLTNEYIILLNEMSGYLYITKSV